LSKDITNTTVIAVTGGSGSGKTSLIRAAEELFDISKLCVVSMDNYYLPREKQPEDNLGFKNFDTPGALDYIRLVKDLRNLLAGKTVRQDVYTFNNPQKPDLWLEIKPANIILIEGLYFLCHDTILELINYIVFVEAREDLMLRRRIRRDNVERGYDLEDVVYRFENHVTPAYQKYVLPFRNKADIIIKNNGPIEEQVKLFQDWINKIL